MAHDALDSHAPERARNPLFTVFTPTFNRADTLPLVHRSLEAQTFRDFEWLVVDDGSTDGTEQRVAGWQASSTFPIRYMRQENQGKHIAHNRGVAAARGELFLVLDSDDTCVPHALETFKRYWDDLPTAERENFYGVTGLCQYEDGTIVGAPFPTPVFDSDPRELFYRYRVGGEKWGVGRTDILRAYPFDESERRVWVPESMVWFKIAERYRTRYINEALRTYRILGPSMVQGRTPWHNAYARQVFALRCLNDDLTFFWSCPHWFVAYAMLFVRFSYHLGLGWRAQRAALTNLAGRCLHLAAWPGGALLFQIDRWRQRTGARALATRQ